MKACWPMLKEALLAVVFLFCGTSLYGQARLGCSPATYRIISSHWDAVLRMRWELRQDCMHPERPVRAVEIKGSAESSHPLGTVADNAAYINMRPLLVHAGDCVRLWQQEAKLRIDMSGIAEQSASEGDRIVVRITSQMGNVGVNVQRYAGIVRATGDVEMERSR